MSTASSLSGKRVAVLATDGFEQSELQEPKRLLESWGAQVDVIAPGDASSIRGWSKQDWGASVQVDKRLAQADAGDYDALLLPGGVINPDKLRTEASAIRFIQSFASAGKPVAAICHGPWLLAESGLVRDKQVTSWPSVKTDLSNAGARWQDAEVVVDGNLITSRKPDDIPAFAAAVAKALG
ncbi:type 1 glutamine amidotransferase [Xanthomonas translucens pv. undulosa]|uniref:type 1 glutamine amidotransferase domain-containing protein n=1 Tax=Xanthomonas campestris pv. translucens TaxID=343 RepID=UPI00071E7867|nr:type 1 glutamine amidotransferase domain-containing protein [Xanthomonas translucens]QSQ43207.1 type 1 glutamine amidotransferase [Xanthomonas translucens pv. translucens]QSQ48939.1 type 1 glutamine amidotransferase [Xanthomonas translucens pv. undulosa]UJB13976.1 type 1 glutamine amidotransferase [Xanthomonas translucens pv. undulosa]WKZ99864.1 type 1 glutamine amidotransferase [Xanthomonas translucens]